MSMTEGHQEGLGLFPSGRPPSPDTGGADIGHWGQVGGTLPLLHPVATVATDILPELGVRALKQRQAAKDYNDQRTSTTAGSIGGQKVEDVTGMGEGAEAAGAALLA
jgi:hypothetical protein